MGLILIVIAIVLIFVSIGIGNIGSTLSNIESHMGEIVRELRSNRHKGE